MAIFNELHSEEVHEIISRPPPGLVRWGMTLLLGVVVLLGLGSWLVQYPDVVTTSCVLTSSNAPRKVVVRVEGKLARLLVEDRQAVKQGEALAYSESTADPSQVLELSAMLETLRLAAQRNDWGVIQRLSLLPYQ